MKINRNILVLIIAFLLFATNVEGDEWSELRDKVLKPKPPKPVKVPDPIKRAGDDLAEDLKNTRDFVGKVFQSGNQVVFVDGQNVPRNKQGQRLDWNPTKRVWGVIDEEAARKKEEFNKEAERKRKLAAEAKKKAEAKARKYNDDIKIIDSEYNETKKSVQNASVFRKEKINVTIDNIKNDTEAIKDSLERKTNSSIQSIKSDIKTEKLKSMKNVNIATIKIDQFNRNNPKDVAGIQAAFDSVKTANRVQTVTKPFGTSVSINNKFSSGVNKVKSIESTGPAKGLHKWGKRASVENIESSEIARELNSIGKGASVENIESSEIARELNSVGKGASVENLQHSQFAKMLHTVGKPFSAENLRNELSNGIGYIITRALYAVMEKPNIITVGSGMSGAPVYYVNGMFTSENTARFEAQELSDKLQRPVRLVLNKSIVDGVYPGSPQTDDFSEAVYDREWPLTLGSAPIIPNPVDLIYAPIAAVNSVRVPFTQLNLTTRWLTHILYHENGPITIVSHSQGCIITRNAIFTTYLLGKREKMKDSISWVATGNPLNDNEIFVQPVQYCTANHEDDFVANFIGFREDDWSKLNKKGFAASAHEPTDNYIPFIENLTSDTTWQDFRLFVTNGSGHLRISGNFVESL